MTGQLDDGTTYRYWTFNKQVPGPFVRVRVGDTVEARVHDRLRVLDVARVIDKRVGAPVAAECVVDRSPAPPPREVTPPVFVRDRGTGRPTKRDRRQLDRFRAR